MFDSAEAVPDKAPGVMNELPGYVVGFLKPSDHLIMSWVWCSLSSFNHIPDNLAGSLFYLHSRYESLTFFQSPLFTPNQSLAPPSGIATKSNTLFSIFNLGVSTKSLVPSSQSGNTLEIKKKITKQHHLLTRLFRGHFQAVKINYVALIWVIHWFFMRGSLRVKIVIV